jgi:starch-binding outer membrane protein, SusD/RagB family
VDVTGQNVYKYFGETTSGNKGNDDAASNKVYIRWADVLLWKAEALNETGAYADAIAIINSIRERARTTVRIDGTHAPAGTLPDRDVTSTNKEQIKNWLIQERRVELGFESQRFNDLKRWGLAKSFLTGLGKNFQDKNYLYPIPQGDIDKSGGTITQNPGY